MKSRFLLCCYIACYALLAYSLIFSPSLSIRSVVLSAVAALLYPLPVLLEKIIPLVFPPLLKLMSIGFVFLCVYLGGVLYLFEIVSYWDKIIHFISGFLLTTYVFALFPVGSGGMDILRRISPVCLVLVIIACATALGLVWEYLEFTCDLLFSSNLQMNKNLFPAENNSLLDSMTDLLAAQAGTLLMGCYYGRLMRREKWLALEKVIIQKLK